MYINLPDNPLEWLLLGYCFYLTIKGIFEMIEDAQFQRELREERSKRLPDW